VIVSPDYPLRLRHDAWRGVTALRTLTQVRPAALDTVSDVLLLIDYLARRPDVDPHRIFLIGGSLGAVVAAVAGGVDARPAAVVLLYGGGNLGSLIAHTLRHPAQDAPVASVLAPLVGYALAWWLTPLAPERYAPAISPRTLIMINGADDSLVPRRYAVALHRAAREPKELIWVSGEHVEPSETALLERLSGLVTARLVAHGLLGVDQR
jgi:dienelactone hydrolase